MLVQGLVFILETIFNLLTLAALLRFYMQLTRTPFNHPFSQFIAAITDFAVLPLRRVIPGAWGWDMASLVLAFLLQLTLVLSLLAVMGFPFSVASPAAFVGIIFLSIVKLMKLSLYILMGAVLVQAVLSWVNPYNPLMPFLNNLTRPFLRPIQKRVPLIANVDVSPLILFFICQLLLIIPIAWLEEAARRMI